MDLGDPWGSWDGSRRPLGKLGWIYFTLPSVSLDPWGGWDECLDVEVIVRDQRLVPLGGSLDPWIPEGPPENWDSEWL